jgi:pectinesterase
VVSANGFEATNLTISNDTDESTASGATQAVALLTRGDQIVLDSVRLIGNQDTFYARGVSPALAVRVYVVDSYIEGDTDFIFGDARIVIENSTIHVVGDRKANGAIVAPSTHALNPYGILVTESTITAGEGMNVVALGRAWDEGQGDLANYLSSVESGDYPNGAAVIRDSQLDAPIGAAAWSSAATTGRPFSSIDTDAPKNRLYEYGNTGEGSAQ